MMKSFDQPSSGDGERRLLMLPLLLIVFVDLMAMMMILPLLPFYAESFGASAFQVGLLQASFALSQLLAAPVLGAFCDRYGRKKILVVSQIASGMGLMMMGVSQSLPMLFAARILAGAGAGNIVVAQTCLADQTPPEERAAAFGKIGVALGLGLLFGPALTSYLYPFGPTYPIWFAATLSWASLIVTWRFVHPSRPQIKGAPISYRQPWMAPFLVFAIGFGYFAGGLGLFLEARFGFGAQQLAYLFTYCGVLGILFQGIMLPSLVKRFGEIQLSKIGFLANAGAFAALAFSSSLLALVGCATLFSFGNSMMRPNLTSLISRQVGAAQQGQVLGITFSLSTIGQLAGAPIGGALLDGAGPASWAAALALIFCIGPLYKKFCYLINCDYCEFVKTSRLKRPVKF